MLKKISRLFVVFLLILFQTTPVFAREPGTPLVVDDADVLTDYEEELLEEDTEDISDQYNCDVIVLTVDSIYGASAKREAANYFNAHNYGIGEDRDGIILLLAIDDHKYGFATHGEGIINLFHDSVLESMGEDLVPYLRDEDYYGAIDNYAQNCKSVLSEENTSEESGGIFQIVINAIVSVIGGVLSALGIGSVKKSNLQSVHTQVAAENYIKRSSFQLFDKQDRFLHSDVTRTRHPDPSDDRDGFSSTTFTSDDGDTFGGSEGSW